MKKHNNENTSNGAGGLWGAMVDTVKSGNPVVVKGVVAIGIVMMVVNATRVLGQLF